MLKRKICVGEPDAFRNKVFTSPLTELKGVIRYDPERKGLKSNASCCIIEVDSGVSDFYRSQVIKEYGIKLAKPSWGAHISIVQGSIEKDNELFKKYWGKYDGVEVVFQYYAFPRFSGDTKAKTSTKNGSFWFLDVECEMFIKIREELGIETNFRPHLTIARKW